MATAAILAGGKATRFGGRDKSALVVDGRTILERLIAELSTVSDDILIVGAPPGSPALSERREPKGRAPSERSESKGSPRIRMIADRVPDHGPLGGLDAALAAARDDVLVLVACDMPFVTGRFARYLAELATEADAVVPQTERGYHPLCAAYTQACRSAVTERLRQRRLKLADLMNDVRVRVVTPLELDAFDDHYRLLANINTPAEFESLARFGHEL